MKLDLSSKSELDWLAHLLADVESAVPDLNPLLVGAQARDLLLHYGHGIEIERGTADVDFAIAVDDWGRFSAAREALIVSGLFAPDRTMGHRLLHVTFGRIDFIPFGAVERPDGTIAWPPTGDELMDVLGYAEAAAAALMVELPERQTVRIVSLPMLAVLKVLAWNDRHRFTQGKDAVDLWLILCRYLEAGNLDRLYSELQHLLSDKFDFEPTAGWLLGRDARAALQEHSKRFGRLIERLNVILAPQLVPEEESTLVLQMKPHDPGRALRLLAAFHGGLMGASTP